MIQHQPDPNPAGDNKRNITIEDAAGATIRGATGAVAKAGVGVGVGVDSRFQAFVRSGKSRLLTRLRKAQLPMGEPRNWLLPCTIRRLRPMKMSFCENVED